MVTNPFGAGLLDVAQVGGVVHRLPLLHHSKRHNLPGAEIQPQINAFTSEMPCWWLQERTRPSFKFIAFRTEWIKNTGGNRFGQFKFSDNSKRNKVCVPIFHVLNHIYLSCSIKNLIYSKEFQLVLRFSVQAGGLCFFYFPLHFQSFWVDQTHCKDHRFPEPLKESWN